MKMIFQQFMKYWGSENETIVKIIEQGWYKA